MMTRNRTTARREAGFTLVEIMVVLAMVAILAVTIGRSMTRPGNAAAAAGWARRVWVALRTANTMAVNNGVVSQVVFATDGKNLTISHSTVAGPIASGSWILVGREETAQAQVEVVMAGAVTAVVATPAANGLLPANTITFNPDGTATAATVYVRDQSNLYQHKVVNYGLTGLSRHLTRW